MRAHESMKRESEIERRREGEMKKEHGEQVCESRGHTEHEREYGTERV